jgi:predicted N-acetyltransferase YhbS
MGTATGSAVFSDFTVSVATSKDAPAVRALLEASYPVLMQEGYDPTTLSDALPLMTIPNAELLSSGTFYLAKLENGFAVGCGGWSRERPGKGDIEEGLGHIRHFATHPNWAGRGIGRSIYTVCALEARSSGVSAFECFSSLNAEAFYAALGFRVVRQINVEMAPNVSFPTILMQRSI